MSELLKVFNENREVIGVKSREEVHLDGDWHETFHCWFIERVNNTYYIYVQKRSVVKADYPSLYDITAAGHLTADETVEDGVREIKEELGINIQMDELVYLGAILNAVTQGTFIDKEISLVYLYEVKSELQFTFIDQEVENVYRLALTEFENLLKEEVLTAKAEVYEGNSFKGHYIMISRNKIVPHEAAYFEKVLYKINEYVNRKGDTFD